ncbi:MAG: Gfo/Idh/MocA family protein [Tepidisphaeraceae bacterium]
MRIGIVGCGLIGTKRAKALGAAHALVEVADSNLPRAQHLAAQTPGCVASGDWKTVIDRNDVDAVVVSTTNDMLAPVTLASVRAGKHVLVEKPAARNASEIEPLLPAARDAGVIVKVGFNHRFHPAFLKAREIWTSGALGPLMYIRARYGHGGRLGMEKEWRGNPQIAGGGEMLDQGVHLIDLARWFAGEFVDVAGHVGRYFWDWDVEDNGFAMLKTAQGQVAWLHASCTEWKNLFSFEIFGRDGKLQIDGLGGSYGVERLTFYKMLPQLGPPDTTSWEYPFPDDSWRLEFEHFAKCVEQKKQSDMGNLEDALAALRVVESLYGTGKPVR